MNVTQIVASLAARHGGPSRSVRGLSAGLAILGHKVELLTTGDSGEQHTATPHPSLSVHVYERASPQVLARSPQLSLHLASKPADIIHHHGLWQRTLHYAAQAAKKKGIPLVISPRGMMCDWAWNHHRFKKQLASAFVHPGCFGLADGWHATSTEEAADIRQRGFPQPICVAPNGVMAPSPGEIETEMLHWHEHLPALSGRRVALFYSRFHSKKRVIELIDLWLSLPRGDWVLLLAGIPEEYSAHQLDTYVLRNGGSGRIIVQDGSNRPPPYAIASLFLLPSHSENFGLVVAEALVRGVPVLATDTTPWQELPARGAGICVSWDNYGSALKTLLNQSPEELLESGRNARLWSRDTFSWDKAASRIGSFYEELGKFR
jgi:glycosyltransferase involved in cell wall biosynthesis